MNILVKVYRALLNEFGIVEADSIMEELIRQLIC